MPRSVAFAALTAFVLMLGLGVLFPVLPKFTSELGISDAAAGWLLAAYPLASLVASPWWGRFSNARGRKPALVIGLCGYAVGFILFGFGQTFEQLLMARVLGGLTSAAALPALFAYVADVTPADRRSSGMGALGAGIGLGVTFGPAIGALTDAWLGVRAPYFVSGAIGLANALVVAIALPESLTAEARSARDRAEAPAVPLLRIAAPLMPFLICSFLTSTARIAVDSTFGFFAQASLGATPRGIAAVLTAMGVASAIVQGGVLRSLVGRVSDTSLFVAGCSLMSAGLAAFGFASSWAGFLASGMPVAIGFALLSPTLTAMLSRAAESAQGEAQGLNGSATALSRVIGPLLFTTGLWPRVGGPGTYAVAAALAALALGVALARFRTASA
jgi:MFS transporter, DHA1 family, multidrug resistance protein